MAEYNGSRFNQQDIELAGFARALSHPGRVAILKALAQKEAWSSGEISALLPLSQSTVSQHIHKLVSAGLVIANSKSAQLMYSINWEVLKTIEGRLPHLFAKDKLKKD